MKMWVPVVLLVALLCGCDGVLRLEGRVLDGGERSEGGESAIRIDRPPPGNAAGLEPLPDATVTVYLGADLRSDRRDLESHRQLSTKTNGRGTFSLETVVSPYGVTGVLIRVERDGYATGEEIFEHESPQDHRVEVILSRSGEGERRR